MAAAGRAAVTITGYVTIEASAVHMSNDEATAVVDLKADRLEIESIEVGQRRGRVIVTNYEGTFEREIDPGQPEDAVAPVERCVSSIPKGTFHRLLPKAIEQALAEAHDDRMMAAAVVLDAADHLRRMLIEEGLINGN